MNEHQVIQAFAKIHGLQPHRADAERFGGMLFSVDSFSEHEDFFANTPPEDIGHDLAVGACTDLLACGVRPEGLFQAWNLDDAHPQSYYEAVARGIEAVLAHYGARCIGGDVGGASPWCWTATVVAHCPPTGGVTRVAVRREPFELYASGRFGAANLAVFGGQPMPRFALREPVPADALFATDSSGGFFDALENFRRVNRQFYENCRKCAKIRYGFLNPKRYALLHSAKILWKACDSDGWETWENCLRKNEEG